MTTPDAFADPAPGPFPETPVTPSAAYGLELVGVRAGYGKIEILHGLDLAVPVGSVFALLGPNGAGKSTLLKVAGGRLPARSGEVRVHGEVVRRPSADRFARLGVCTVPEGRGIFPNLTVRENLLMWTYRGAVATGAGVRKIKLGEAEQIAYDRFKRLGERRKQLAGTLSGGEQQMLAFSRALIGRPHLLLLDEISMGLAPLIVAELYDVVGHLAAEGITVVLAEQFVQTAMSVATHAAIVVNGRIDRVGAPQEIAAAAAGAYLSGAGAPPG